MNNYLLVYYCHNTKYKWLDPLGKVSTCYFGKQHSHKWIIYHFGRHLQIPRKDKNNLSIVYYLHSTKYKYLVQRYILYIFNLYRQCSCKMMTHLLEINQRNLHWDTNSCLVFDCCRSIACKLLDQWDMFSILNYCMECNQKKNCQIYLWSCRKNHLWDSCKSLLLS
jgi:hypothetical protein